MNTHTRHLPDLDGGSGWWKLLPEPPPARRLEAARDADVVVIGAGFTGIAAAWRLAELQPRWQIVLLEATRVGFGPSGRNSGFVGDLAHRKPSASSAEVDAQALVGRTGRELLAERVRSAGITCDWAEIGRLHVAREAHALANLHHLGAVLEARGEAHERLDADALAKRLGTRYYTEGAFVPSTVLVQPAALVRGLAAALPPRVRLFEESPVVSIQGGPASRGTFEISAGAGSVQAERVVLATNGFAPAMGVACRRVFPLLTFASLTRPLTQEEQGHLGGLREWGVVSEDRMGSSLRRTRDQRLLVRNTVRYAPSLRTSPAAAAAAIRGHEHALRSRFPALERLLNEPHAGLEHCWGGVLGMTIDQGHVFGELAPHVYAAIAFNGTGVAMGTGAGTAIADLIAGQDSHVLRAMRALPRAGWLPPDPFLGLGVSAYTGYLQWRAGAER